MNDGAPVDTLSDTLKECNVTKEVARTVDDGVPNVTPETYWDQWDKKRRIAFQFLARIADSTWCPPPKTEAFKDKQKTNRAKRQPRDRNQSSRKRRKTEEKKVVSEETVESSDNEDENKDAEMYDEDENGDMFKFFTEQTEFDDWETLLGPKLDQLNPEEQGDGAMVQMLETALAAPSAQVEEGNMEGEL